MLLIGWSSIVTTDLEALEKALGNPDIIIDNSWIGYRSSLDLDLMSLR